MSKVNIEKIISYCEQAVGCPYWYGVYGLIATKELYNIKKKQYPKYYQWECKDNQTGVNPAKQLGRPAFDCVGVFKGALWTDGDFSKKPKYNPTQDVSADGMYNKCNRRGTAKTFKKERGAFVFKKGHIGIYIGNNTVIEAKGHKWGVIKSKYDSAGWTKWGFCDEWIDYSTKTENKPAATPQAQKKTENKKTVTKTNKYYKKCNDKYRSIVDALNSIGVNSSYQYRKKIALANGMKRYSGTTTQNIALLNMLKAGKLKKV